MMISGVMFGKVVAEVCASSFPEDAELVCLAASISDPTETHIHGFGSALHGGRGCH
jgi:hypothetical protein